MQKKKNKYSFIIYYYHSIFRIHQSSAPLNYPVECTDRHLNVINWSCGKYVVSYPFILFLIIVNLSFSILFKMFVFSKKSRLL